MKPAKPFWRRGYFALLIPLAMMSLHFSGCFTEVGNAEDDHLVQANFRIEYSANAQPLPKAGVFSPSVDSISFLNFYLLIKEATYHTADSATGALVERYLWKEDSAVNPVDFTGRDAMAILPLQHLGKSTLVDLKMECKVPRHGALLPDTMELDRFSDPGYIKGVLYLGGKPLPFLFALPTTEELYLSYSQAAVDGWYQGNTYQCEFAFFATKWVAGEDFSPVVTSLDKTGKPFALFDGQDNSALYADLTSRFYKSFNTEQASSTDK